MNTEKNPKENSLLFVRILEVKFSLYPIDFVRDTPNHEDFVNITQIDEEILWDKQTVGIECKNLEVENRFSLVSYFVRAFLHVCGNLILRRGEEKYY